MKKKPLLKYFLGILIISVVLVLVLMTRGAARHAPAAALTPDAIAPNNSDPQDNRSLRERARETGYFVARRNPARSDTFADLRGLANRSSAVIIGTPQRNMSTLSPDGRSITIDYQVTVRHVFKGALREGDTVTVSLPGGQVRFDDGSVAEIQTPWFRKMLDGSTYALFLREDGRRGAFVTTGEAQGVFEIPVTRHSRAVKVHSGIRNDPIWRYHNMDVRTFLREVRQATSR